MKTADLAVVFTGSGISYVSGAISILEHAGRVGFFDDTALVWKQMLRQGEARVPSPNTSGGKKAERQKFGMRRTVVGAHDTNDGRCSGGYHREGSD
jgi:hypothetical protein